MSNVNIDVFQIARTQVDRVAVREWLDRIDADEYEIPDGSSASDPALLIALAAKRCYMSFQPGLNPNVTKVRKDMVEYIDNILASGHGSVLEHSVFTFAIEGVSRVFTAEMNRHRDMQDYVRRWIEEHRDGREDTWTPEAKGSYGSDSGVLK